MDSRADTVFLTDTVVGAIPAPRPKANFQPTRQAIESAAGDLQYLRLSDTLLNWVNRYDRVGERHRYLWTWCRRGVEVTSLSCLDRRLWELICDTKVLGVMLDVLVDDVADEHGDFELLRKLVRLPDGVELHPEDHGPLREYVALIVDVWSEIQRRVAILPRFREYQDLLAFDYAQLMNTMRYAHLLNAQPALMNLAEHDLYLPHNMHMMVSATIDLMASPDFDPSEIGRVREAIWHAQYMGRIGNLVTTWQREIHQRDFTSGVFAHAVTAGTLRVEDLDDLPPDTMVTLIQQGGHEEYFLQRWQQHRLHILALAPRVTSVDLTRLVRGLEQLICLHLGSRGRK